MFRIRELLIPLVSHIILIWMCFLRVLWILFFAIMGMPWLLLHNHNLRMFSLIIQQRGLVGDQFSRLARPRPPLKILWLCFE